MTDFTFDEMKRALIKGWGDVGAHTADCWLRFNAQHFEGKLKPLPIFFTPVAPYGKAYAWTCCGGEHLTHIALCRPRLGGKLVADKNTLLHEMIHQHLNESGDDPRHETPGWRAEIMRLHYELTGEKIFAGRSLVKKQLVDGSRKSVRRQETDPTGALRSLSQVEIASWPSSLDIRLGSL